MIALAAIALLGANTFDLACEGTIRQGFPMVTDPVALKAAVMSLPSRPYSVRYRVDLDGYKWCSGDCEELSAIERYQPTSMQIDGLTIDRTNGEGQKFIPDKQLWYFVSCKREAYSGMPESLF